MAAWTKQDYPTDKPQCYALLLEQLTALAQDERDAVANMANMSALLYQALDNVNWAGFYLMKQGMLVLGPFQGMPACIRIPVGRGVCGTAAHTQRPQLVPDVHLFPGHIACDSASQSEIVIPLMKDGRLLGVLDIDSPVKQRFDTEDERGLTRLVQLLVNGSDWPC